MESDSTRLLAVLLRLEQARQPLTDRTTLASLLTEVAAALADLSSASAVQIAVQPALFDPPLALIAQHTAAGASASVLQEYDVIWGRFLLATVTVHLPPEVLPPQDGLPLLLRVAAESIAEVWAAERLAQQVAEQTRRDLAHELHDAGKQVLPAIRLFAERAERELSRDPQTAVALLRDISNIAQQGLDDMSFWLGDLRGQRPEHDLRLSLERLLAQVQHAAPDLRVEQQIALPVLPPRIAACVLGIARNGVSNVLQHAHATHLRLEIGLVRDGLRISVADNGIGAQPDAAIAAPGIGLESILERVATLGGHSTFETAPGQGMHLEAWVPLPPKERSDG